MSAPLRSAGHLALIALLAGASPASAQSLERRHETARQIVAEKLGSDYTHEQIAVLNLIAHAAAASTLCDTLDLDEAKVEQQLTAVINASVPATADQPGRDALRNRTLVGFGSLLGLMLEDAAPNNKAFCTKAEKERVRDGASSFLKVHASGK